MDNSTTRSKTSIGFVTSPIFVDEGGKKLQVSPHKNSLSPKRFPQIKTILTNVNSNSSPAIPAPIGVVNMLNEDVRKELSKNGVVPSGHGPRIVKSPVGKNISPNHGSAVNNTFNTNSSPIRGPHMYNPKLPQITEKNYGPVNGRRINNNIMYMPEDYTTLLKKFRPPPPQQQSPSTVSPQLNINLNSNFNNNDFITPQKSSGIILSNSSSSPTTEGKPILLLEIENYLHRSLQDLASKIHQRRRETQNEYTNPEKVTTPNDVLQRYKIHREGSF